MAIVSKKLNHLLWPLLLLLCLLGCQSPERTRPADIVKAYEPIPIDADASHIIVDVQIGDRKYPFLLDTGCTNTIYDERLREKLGKSIGHGELIETGQQIQTFKSIDAYISGINMRDEAKIACMDLSEVSNKLSADIYGVVGMSFLRGRRIVIDKANGTVRLEKKGAQICKSWGKGWEIHNRNKYPYVYIDEMKEEFLIDTGDSSSGALNKRVFRKVMLHEGLSPRTCSSFTIAGTIRQRHIRTIRIRILGMEYNSMEFSEKERKCVIGLEFLARHKVLLDFAGNRMYLKKGKRFSWPDALFRTGMVLGFFENTIKVLHVVSMGNADNLGIVKGDVIVNINGIGMEDLSLGSIDRIFEKDEVKVNLIRDGQRKTILFLYKKRETEKVK
jgi:predicted aspartyl protease